MTIQCVKCRKVKTRNGWEYARQRKGRGVRKLETLCPHCARLVYKTGFKSRSA